MKKLNLLFKTLIIVSIVVIIKLVFHYFKIELISINPLFSGIITANVFLLGFLLTGVLSDYKESEKLPGELASSIEAIKDEVSIIYKAKNSENAKKCLEDLKILTISIKDWFHKKEKISEIQIELSNFNNYFLEFEKETQANFITRMKQEQNNIRKSLTRIHTIRDTNFISSGYLIAKTTTFALVFGLILSKIEPFYESLFFMGVIVFMLVFMLNLIKDLDNPFSYYEKDAVEEVSLYPLNNLIDRW